MIGSISMVRPFFRTSWTDTTSAKPMMQSMAKKAHSASAHSGSLSSPSIAFILLRGYHPLSVSKHSPELETKRFMPVFSDLCCLCHTTSDPFRYCVAPQSWVKNQGNKRDNHHSIVVNMHLAWFPQTYCLVPSPTPPPPSSFALLCELFSLSKNCSCSWLGQSVRDVKL